MKVIKYIRKEYKDIRKVLFKRTTVFNRKKILHKKYRKISFIVIALLVIVNMTIFSFNAFSQMGVQEANSLESYAVVAYTEPGSHTWTVPNGVSSVDVLVVAGGAGGGGGDPSDGSGGGGGAGGLIFEENIQVTSGNSISIMVGAGGAGKRGDGENGEDSVAFGLTALGGGGGGDGDATHNGLSGGSGGGGGGNHGVTSGGSALQPSSADGGFGNPGGGATTNSGDEGSGGGGAGEAGGDGLSYSDTKPAGAGGDGLYYGDIFGDRYGENGWFAGGGAGHADRGGWLTEGGLGGGGNHDEANGIVENGMANTGGGGAGGGKYSTTEGPLEGGDGGSGIVLIKYKVNLGTLQGSTLNKGLVGHWTMDEVDYNSSNNRLTDKTPYVNHGINNGGTFTVDRFGKVEGAMSFNESNYVDIDNNLPNMGNFTFSMWVYKENWSSTGSNSRQDFLGVADSWNPSPTSDNITLYQDSMAIKGTRGAAAGPYITASVQQDSGWVHVGFVQERISSTNVNVKVYINGQESANVSGDYEDIVPSVHLWIGMFGPNHTSYSFDGSIDDTRIYNRALSESEIKSLYDSYEPKISAGSLNKGLVLDMPLTLKYTKDETTGSEIMTDKTPYSNDGQNNGATINEEGASFDGSNDYIKIPKDSIFFSNSWTKTAFVKFNGNSGSYEGIFWAEGATVGGESGKQYLLALYNYQYIHYRIGNTISGWVNTNTPIIDFNPEEWNHIAWSFNNGTTKIYINGNLWHTDTSRGSYNAGDDSGLYLGARNDGSYLFNGQINNVKIFDRALSDTEVKRLYDKGRDSGSGMTIKPYGSVPGMAGLSCLDILDNNPSAINNDGVYWINPEGDNPFQVYCDMTTDGGGWTIGVFNNPGTINSAATFLSYCDSQGLGLAGEGVEDVDSWLAIKRYLWNTNHQLKQDGWPDTGGQLAMPIISTPPTSIYDGASCTIPSNWTGDHCNAGQEPCGYWFHDGWNDPNLSIYPDPEDWGGWGANYYACIYRE